MTCNPPGYDFHSATPLIFSECSQGATPQKKAIDRPARTRPPWTTTPPTLTCGRPLRGPVVDHRSPATALPRGQRPRPHWRVDGPPGCGTLTTGQACYLPPFFKFEITPLALPSCGRGACVRVQRTQGGAAPGGLGAASPLPRRPIGPGGTPWGPCPPPSGGLLWGLRGAAPHIRDL